mmetsp:Transcript_32972/g.60364  ORF Transcript_32972/g.60364 Transcript_32972/m.60364 type:complete len:194 (-) Transcript_32972:15-596(-)
MVYAVLLLSSLLLGASAIKDLGDKNVKEEPVEKKAVMRKVVMNETRMFDLGDGLHFQEKKTGDEETFAKHGDRVQVHYITKLDGKKVDSSRDDWNEPFEFTVGSDAVVSGWNEAIEKLSLGERGVLHVPAKLAYGQDGAGVIIPPNADLDYDIEVLGINGKTVESNGGELEAFGTPVGGEAMVSLGFNADADV